MVLAIHRPAFPVAVEAYSSIGQPLIRGHVEPAVSAGREVLDDAAGQHRHVVVRGDAANLASVSPFSPSASRA